MGDNEMFKTTLMGGYDREDVAEQFNTLKDAHASSQNQLKKDLAEKETYIEELKNKLEEKAKQKDQLEKDISNKYQKYIDHHNSISHLLVDAQIKADEIVGDAKKTRDHMIVMTEVEIKRKFDSVQAEVDERVAEGERKYKAIQSEMEDVMELINQAQKRFMVSYKEIHKIISDLPKRTTDGVDESADD